MAELTVRNVEIPAGTIQVHEIGSGTPLVFIHGALVGWQLWEAIARPLAERGYRVIMPTMPMGAHPIPMKPGTDLTPPGLAKLVVDLIQALELDRPTLISNDTCTAINQIVLTSHPGVLGRAIFTSGDCFRYFFPPMYKPLQALGYAPGLLKRVGQATRNEKTRNSPVGFGYLTKRGISDEIAVDWTESLINDKGVRRDAAAVLRGVSTKYTMRAAKRFPTIDVPVMLLWGEIDKAFPMKLAHRLAELIPDCRLEVIPDAAAFVSIDAPDTVVSLIEDFVPLNAMR